MDQLIDLRRVVMEYIVSFIQHPIDNLYLCITENSRGDKKFPLLIITTHSKILYFVNFVHVCSFFN